jgi:hypothetical protein
MGGGGFLGLGPAPSAPPAPDYSGAARATAAGNIDAARLAVAANRVNQYTPYGSLEYTMSGEDKYGNPMWSATQKFSPENQKLFDIQNKLSFGVGELGETGLGYVRKQLENPFDVSGLPSIGINPSETYTDAYLRRLAPQMQQSRDKLEQQLANQGIQIGSEAYDRAIRNFDQKQNDLMLGATTQGFDVGNRARAAQFAELAYLRNEPLNVLSALRTGSQVTSPTYVNSAQQATTSGPDLLGAQQMQYNAQMGDFNAKNAAQANLNQGLFSLASAGIPLMSDIRAKENIKAIGVMDNGLTLYSFEYKDEVKSHPLAGDGIHVGVMAQEVEQVFPYAVKTLDDGYKVVDYGLLP